MQEKLITAPSDDELETSVVMSERGRKSTEKAQVLLVLLPEDFGSHYYPINEQKRMVHVPILVSAQVN